MAVHAEPIAARPPAWRDPRVRSIVFQVVVALALVLFAAFIIHNTTTNLAKRGIASGFEFLRNISGFPISQSLVHYELTSTYGRVFVVGLLNTLLVSVIGVVLATILGFVIGILRLSRNWLIGKLAAVYVETLRNIPLLVQCFFWYFGLITPLPGPRQSLSIADAFFVNARGIYTPGLVPEPGFAAVPVAFLIGIVATVVVARWAKRRQLATGQQFPTGQVGLALIVGLPVLAALVTGLPWSWDYPELKGFNFAGGWWVQPEFLALLLALTMYTAAFIAEIVRAGILAVSHGQTEAAYALGLRPGTTTRLVIIPQALRVIVPPLTSQYLNLVKNSSLGVAIAYPDLVSVFAGTTLNQTGQAVECIAMTMGVYLVISLGISAFMNWYNRRIALVER
ncbi:MAG: amino acid ABC transporter permease [Dongiaceae bacterium]